MDIRLEQRTAAHPKREEIERLHETMKKRELGRKRRRLWSRFGVNLVMYVLTGNYKSDQVHVPALLERLGQ